MTRPRVAVRLVTLAFAVIPLACGMRGAPLPPLVIVPAQITDFTAERLGDEVYLQLTIPNANADRSEPADLERVEVYALTTQPSEDQPRLSADDWLEMATLIATLEVEPVEPDDESGTEEQPRYAQGAEVTLIEVLTAENQVPIELEEDEPEDEELPAEADATLPAGPLLAPPLPQPARRTYLARAISTRGRESRPSRRVPIPLSAAPDPPGAPTVTYTADSISIIWTPPPTARLPVEQQIDGALPSTTLLPLQTPSRYDVYDLSPPPPDPEEESLDEEDTVEPEPTGGVEMPLAANGAPLAVLFYSAAAPMFDVERCFAVRTVDEADPTDELLIRSPSSETTCVMLIDTFPPSAPTGLVAVAAEGAVSLTWVESAGDDVSGYLVLRGDPSGETLDPLIMDPITVTNFRDTTVEAGQRYAYAVQAIDGATPPNVSSPSVRVVEQAR